MEIVKELRRILTELGFDADEFLPLESEAPLIIGLKAIMHDICHTVNLAAKRNIEAKNEAGVATFGAAGWQIDDPELRELEEAYLGKKFTECSSKNLPRAR